MQHSERSNTYFYLIITNLSSDRIGRRLASGQGRPSGLSSRSHMGTLWHYTANRRLAQFGDERSGEIGLRYSLTPARSG